MKLDFAALSGPAPVPPMRKPWGPAGTVGTLAFMRLPASPGGGDGPGTSGDGGATLPTNIGMAAGVGGFAPVPCPQVSPPCPHCREARRANEINVSPMSPLVPGLAGKNAGGEDFDREAFDERAAIMEFDGGMTRAEAEAAALLSVMA